MNNQPCKVSSFRHSEGNVCGALPCQRPGPGLGNFRRHEPVLEPAPLRARPTPSPDPLHAGLEQASSGLEGRHELRGQAQERAAEACPARSPPWGDNTDKSSPRSSPAWATDNEKTSKRQYQTAAGVTTTKQRPDGERWRFKYT